MEQRRFNVSTGAGGETAVRRTRFDAHLDGCGTCKTDGALCSLAQTLWRLVVTTAMRTQRGQS